MCLFMMILNAAVKCTTIIFILLIKLFFLQFKFLKAIFVYNNTQKCNLQFAAICFWFVIVMQLHFIK